MEVMMKIIKYFLLLLTFAISATLVQAHPAKKYSLPTRSNWNALCKKYFPPMVVSGMVGGVTGGFVRYIEKELNIQKSPEYWAWLVIAWFTEYNIRNSIIMGIQRDFDECRIPHKKSIMHITACVASWMAYLQS
jgi:hypothetical protein